MLLAHQHRRLYKGIHNRTHMYTLRDTHAHMRAHTHMHTHTHAHTHARSSQGILHAAYCMRRDEGVVAFYRGLVPSMIGILPYAGERWGGGGGAAQLTGGRLTTCTVFWGEGAVF